MPSFVWLRSSTHCSNSGFKPLNTEAIRSSHLCKRDLAPRTWNTARNILTLCSYLLGATGRSSKLVEGTPHKSCTPIANIEKRRKLSKEYVPWSTIHQDSKTGDTSEAFFVGPHVSRRSLLIRPIWLLYCSPSCDIVHYGQWLSPLVGNLIGCQILF